VRKAKFKMAAGLEYSGDATTFHGYEHLVCEHSKVTAIYVDGTPVTKAKAGDDVVIVLDHTPFYAESGGQVGDTGELRNAALARARRGHRQGAGRGVRPPGPHRRGRGRGGRRVRGPRRRRAARKHRAQPQRHAPDAQGAARGAGRHVQQKGSLVNAERTRFDFAHNAPVTDAQIAQVEAIVNAEILANAATQARVLPIDEAQKLGAMMLFGEKYGDEVRVLDIGSSRELCGGTHVQRTGDIGLFKIVAESGIAAGIRRVEAVTGDNALAYLQQLEGTVGRVAGALKVTPAEVPAASRRCSSRCARWRRRSPR
jgi:alanyl-tRNA synthetase